MGAGYIAYLNANNLYGWAVSQPLPSGNFEWSEERCGGAGGCGGDDQGSECERCCCYCVVCSESLNEFWLIVSCVHSLVWLSTSRVALTRARNLLNRGLLLYLYLNDNVLS